MQLLITVMPYERFDTPITDEPIDWNAINAIYNLSGDNSYYYGGSYFCDSVNTEITSEIISQIEQTSDVSTTIQPTTNSTYTVQGQTAQEAWNNAKNTSVTRTIESKQYTKGTEERGQTVWHYKPNWVYNYTVTPVAGGSYKIEVTVNKATLTLTKDVLMPVWEGYASASQTEKDKWDTEYNKLKSHETGHENIVENGVTKVANALDAETPFPSSFFVSNWEKLVEVNSINFTRLRKRRFESV